MIRIGLTGGIATGKSTVAAQFALMGVPRYDADDAVHVLFKRKGPVRSAVMSHFPKAVKDGDIDRKALGEIVFQDADALKALEAIVHPAVRAEELAFERQMRRLDIPWFIAEIPLLFEVGGEERFDLIIMTSCPAWLQRQRAFARGNMTEEKFRHILDRQMPAHEKRKQADLEIRTGLGKADSMRQVRAIMAKLRQKQGD